MDGVVWSRDSDHERVRVDFERDTEASALELAACFDSPVDDAKRRHVHHEHIAEAFAREYSRAERCLTTETACHEGPPHAICRDAVASI